MGVLKLRPYVEASYERHASNFERAVKRVDAELEGEKNFLVGNKLTLADIMVGGVLLLASEFLLDGEMRNAAPSIEGYLKGLLEIPEVGNAFGELQLCDVRVKGA